MKSDFKKLYVVEVKRHAVSKLGLTLTTFVPLAVMSMALDPVHARGHQALWLLAYTLVGFVIWHVRNKKLREVQVFESEKATKEFIRRIGRRAF